MENYHAIVTGFGSRVLSVERAAPCRLRVDMVDTGTGKPMEIRGDCCANTNALNLA